jgi:glutaredoxin-related protein
MELRDDQIAMAELPNMRVFRKLYDTDKEFQAVKSNSILTFTLFHRILEITYGVPWG